MSAAKVDITIDQGADFACQIVWTDSSEEPQLVIHPARMEMKDKTGAVVLTLESPDVELPPGEVPQIGLSTEMGVIQIYIPDEVTAGLPAGTFSYDLFVTVDDQGVYVGEQTHRLIFGQVTVNRRITVMNP